MSEEMKFPDTLDEFIKQYSFIDREQIYTNGSELIQTFRIKQWEEHKKQEIQSLKKQLDYLRSGEYLNQLKWERNMLEDLVQNGEVSKEDKEFIDMTHRNTELLEQQKEFIEYFENEINKINEQIKNYDIWHEVGTDINFLILKKKQLFMEILSKYKEIIGDDK